MITIIHKIKDWSYLLAICCVGASCSLDIPYENQFSDPDAVTTPAAARELLASAYSELPTPEFNLSVLGDDFEPTYKERQEIRCIVSEAKLLKAYCYFNLLRLFAPAYADGPEKDGIILKDEFKLGFLKRSSIGECVTAIRNLLTEAVEVENNPAQEYWLSQYSGYYLLAELELYAGNYEQAEEYAQKVIDIKGGYDVLTTAGYSKLFGNEVCDERIFSVYTSGSYYTDMNYDRDKGDFFTLNTSLVRLYSEGDIRYDETVYWFAMSGETVGEITSSPYLGKYNKMNWEKKETRYINKFRVAGACFILAEAYCRDGKAHDVQAVKVMNEYLARRGATLLDENLSGEVLLKTVLTEKWKEYAGERYFDLKRCRKEILSDWNVSGSMDGRRIQKDDYRWTFPIPRGEYLYNENVSQNEGWTKIEN